MVYTDPGDGKEKIVELKFINQCTETRNFCTDRSAR
jgi:hypothetical protein